MHMFVFTYVNIMHTKGVLKKSNEETINIDDIFVTQVYMSLQKFTEVYKSLRKFTEVYKSLRMFSDDEKHTQHVCNITTGYCFSPQSTQELEVSRP